MDLWERGLGDVGMSASKWPRSWDVRVPDIDEVDTNDLVALTKAKHQWVRDR